MRVIMPGRGTILCESYLSCAKWFLFEFEYSIIHYILHSYVVCRMSEMNNQTTSKHD